jgi:hypothetical protein
MLNLTISKPFSQFPFNFVVQTNQFTSTGTLNINQLDYLFRSSSVSSPNLSFSTAEQNSVMPSGQGTNIPVFNWFVNENFSLMRSVSRITTTSTVTSGLIDKSVKPKILIKRNVPLSSSITTGDLIEVDLPDPVTPFTNPNTLAFCTGALCLPRNESSVTLAQYLTSTVSVSPSIGERNALDLVFINDGVETNRVSIFTETPQISSFFEDIKLFFTPKYVFNLTSGLNVPRQFKIRDSSTGELLLTTPVYTGLDTSFRGNSGDFNVLKIYDDDFTAVRVSQTLILIVNHIDNSLEEFFYPSELIGSGQFNQVCVTRISSKKVLLFKSSASSTVYYKVVGENTVGVFSSNFSQDLPYVQHIS